MKVIFAPHPDDELIGCYEILNEGDPCTIIFTGEIQKSRLIESNRLQNYFNVTIRYDVTLIRTLIKNLQMGFSEEFYFPDPYWELHPEHKQLGNEGYWLWKNTDLNIIFYSTNMNTPYLHELSDNSKVEKIKMLNDIYASQSDLWKYEHKYYIFEGRIKYLR